MALQNARRAAGETASNIITVLVDEETRSPGHQQYRARPAACAWQAFHDQPRSRIRETGHLFNLQQRWISRMVTSRARGRPPPQRRIHRPAGSDLDAKYPPECTIRIILDNHSAHISKETHAFLPRHPNRFQQYASHAETRNSMARTSSRLCSARCNCKFPASYPSPIPQ